MPPDDACRVNNTLWLTFDGEYLWLNVADPLVPGAALDRVKIAKWKGAHWKTDYERKWVADLLAHLAPEDIS
jgi:hypothetical protein